MCRTPCQARTRVHQSLATCSLSHRLYQSQPPPLRASPRYKSFESVQLSSRLKQPLLLAGQPLAWGAAGNALARRVPGRAGRPQGRASGSRVAGGGWRGQVGLREKWLYFSYTWAPPWLYPSPSRDACPDCTTPCCGPLRRGYRGMLGALQEPWARHDRQRGHWGRRGRGSGYSLIFFNNPSKG